MAEQRGGVPSSRQEADARMDAQQQCEEIEAAKAIQRKLQHTQELPKQKDMEDNRPRRDREREERGRLKAVKAAEAVERKAHRERDKQARDAEKAVQLPQRGKRNAPQVQHLARIRTVVVQQLVVGALFLSAPRHRYPHTTATATKSLRAERLGEKVCRIGLWLGCGKAVAGPATSVTTRLAA
ncbi:hypothetical protein IG631_24259 [Alternaria alternata]|nr:hypothetical protein IG631_24259 [Alternaria alternata]